MGIFYTHSIYCFINLLFSFNVVLYRLLVHIRGIGCWVHKTMICTTNILITITVLLCLWIKFLIQITLVAIFKKELKLEKEKKIEKRRKRKKVMKKVLKVHVVLKRIKIILYTKKNRL